MVYAVCSLTYAAFRKALGRDIAWATDADRRRTAAPGRAAVRVRGQPTPATAARPATCRSATSRPASTPPASRCSDGLIATALSHDIVAHETTHALLDGLRSSFMDPSNVDVPAFHEAFSDLVALFLHFTYADVVERGIRESRGGFARGVAADGSRARIRLRAVEVRTRGALRSGVDISGVAAFDSDALPQPDGTPGATRPSRYDPTLEPHALGSVLVSAVFEAFATVVKRKIERYFRIAGLDPQNLAGAALNDAADQGDSPGGQRRRRPVPDDLHPCHRLLPAHRHGARRVPARDHHRRRGSREAATSGASARRSCAPSCGGRSFRSTCGS